MSQVVEVPSQRVSYSGELAELSTGAPELLTLPTRRVLYLVAIAAVFAGPIVSVAFPEWGTAIVTAGNGIGVIALGTALANPTKS